MELASVLMSAAALILSLFTYFKHERKIKKQEEQINKDQLEKIKAEKVESKRAIVEANVVKGAKGQRTVKVYNRGKAVAREVKVNFKESEGYFVVNNPFPCEIRPQQSWNISLVTFMGGSDIATVELEWKDELQDNNTDSQVLQLY